MREEIDVPIVDPLSYEPPSIDPTTRWHLSMDCPLHCLKDYGIL